MNHLKQSLTRNLKPYSRHIPDINKATMRSLLKLCVAFLEHKKYSKDAFDREVVKLSTASPDGPKSYDVFCTIIFILLETFLKISKSGEDISDILRELKFQEECVEDLSKVLVTNHQSLYENFHEMKTAKPMDQFQYRINISLTGQPPTVILCQDTDQGMKTVNVSLFQFHQFRLAVASSLAEVQALDGKTS